MDGGDARLTAGVVAQGPIDEDLAVARVEEVRGKVSNVMG